MNKYFLVFLFIGITPFCRADDGISKDKIYYHALDKLLAGDVSGDQKKIKEGIRDLIDLSDDNYLLSTLFLSIYRRQCMDIDMPYNWVGTAQEDCKAHKEQLGVIRNNGDIWGYPPGQILVMIKQKSQVSIAENCFISGLYYLPELIFQIKLDELESKKIPDTKLPVIRDWLESKTKEEHYIQASKWIYLERGNKTIHENSPLAAQLNFDFSLRQNFSLAEKYKSTLLNVDTANSYLFLNSPWVCK